MKTWTTSEEFLLDIATPVKTDTYSPIPHQVFVAELQELLYKQKLHVESKKYLIDKTGQSMVGEYMLSSSIDNQMTIAVGFQNSYNKTIKAGITAGGLVLVCKNGMYKVDGSNYQRKHTGTALEDIRTNMITVIGGAEEQLIKLIAKREQMKQIELTGADIAGLVGDMYLHEDLLNTTQLEIVKKSMLSDPNFSDKTVWSLYNWATESFKDAHPTTYMRKHLMLHTYLSDKFGLTEGRSLYGVLEQGVISMPMPQPKITPDFEKNFGPLVATGEFSSTNHVSLNLAEATVIHAAVKSGNSKEPIRYEFVDDEAA